MSENYNRELADNVKELLVEIREKTRAEFMNLIK
tara:strand:- start:99 stop:200 length:102 start_codon:yes stop_codon:yes gene_type:complete